MQISHFFMRYKSRISPVDFSCSNAHAHRLAAHCSVLPGCCIGTRLTSASHWSCQAQKTIRCKDKSIYNCYLLQGTLSAYMGLSYPFSTCNVSRNGEKAEGKAATEEREEKKTTKTKKRRCKWIWWPPIGGCCFLYTLGGVCCSLLPSPCSFLVTIWSDEQEH